MYYIFGVLVLLVDGHHNLKEPKLSVTPLCSPSMVSTPRGSISPAPSMSSQPSASFQPSASSVSDFESKIPDLWRPDMKQAIEERLLTDSSRNSIVRTLVDQLFLQRAKPSRAHCEDLARKFILKYPFFKDDLGNGYVSNMSKHEHNALGLIR